MDILRYALLVVAGLVMSCTPDEQRCPSNGYRTEKYYPFTLTERTALGLALDTTTGAIDAAFVDSAYATLVACLREQFTATPSITRELALQADCQEHGNTLKIEFNTLDTDAACYGAKIAPDWVTDRCGGGEQELPVEGYDYVCIAKGLTPTPECPCRARVETERAELPGPNGAYMANIIITPPNQKFFKAEIARNMTGCNNVWIVPQIVACLP